MLRALQVVIDVPAACAEASAEFWAAALGWRLGETWPDHPEFRSFEPDDARPYVHRQVAGVGHPRIHLDVEVDDIDAGAGRLAELGAVSGTRFARWQAMTSPGGLPFCVVAHRAGPVPAPLRLPDGHRTRLVQVCIDAPRGHFDAEVTFWREATNGWSWSPGESPEFAGKLRPTPNRLQLLFQRLGDDPAGETGEVRAHLDLGTDDRPAEVARLVELGARPGPLGGGWQVLTDPTGMEFCVTDNPPT
jgi:predicted enzyme related to lactoylglutathione lyase